MVGGNIPAQPATLLNVHLKERLGCVSSWRSKRPLPTKPLHLPGSVTLLIIQAYFAPAVLPQDLSKNSFLLTHTHSS